MRSARISLSLLVSALLLVLLCPNLRADEWNKKTTFTFSGPVEVAGHRLEAGTYVFKLADTVDRHVVQITNARENHVYATILAIPDMRLTPTDKTVVKFSESPNNLASNDGNLPQEGLPLKEWFYPGDTDGQEFRVKPAPLVADASATPVLPAADADTSTSEPPAAESSSVTPEPEEKAAEAAAPAAEAPAAEAPESAQAATPAAQPDASSAQTPTKEPADTDSAKTPSELPQTASPLPLIGLIGLISLGVGVSLREALKRSA